MPEAFLPSPASAVWHLGPVPVRAVALCLVAGVLAGLWLTDWRYRRAGGETGTVLRVATIAVPAGLVGARLYSVVTNWHLYAAPHGDWVDALRIWNGGLGIAGAIAAGALAAWLYCRRAGIDIGPLAVAAAPAMPVTQAIAVWGNWFTQTLYGGPSRLPWAVAITPAHRAAGYQAEATFQPVFLYESGLYLLLALVVAYAIRRFSLTGDLAFALYAGLYATARLIVEAQRVDDTPRLLGLRTNEVAMLVIILAAWPYLVAGVRRRHRRAVERAYVPPAPAKPMRPRSDSAVAASLGPAAGRGPAGGMAVAPAEAGVDTEAAGPPLTDLGGPNPMTG
jgi:prolipoprotein diacylglyceryl transferase